MGGGEPGALIEYKQKPLEGWFLKGLPLTPQTLLAQFTAYTTAAGLVGIGAIPISLLFAGNTHQGLGGPGPSRHLTPTRENTSDEKPSNPLDAVLERELSLVPSSLAAPFARRRIRTHHV
jgi:hypothetical protein